MEWMLSTFKHLLHAAVPWPYFTSCYKMYTFRNIHIAIPLMDSFFKNRLRKKKNSGLFHSLFFASATFTVGKVHSLLDLAEHRDPARWILAPAVALGNLLVLLLFPICQAQANTWRQTKIPPTSTASFRSIQILNNPFFFNIWGKVAFSVILVWRTCADLSSWRSF